MTPRQRLIGAMVAAGCALLCALPGIAFASTTQETVLMDDNNLIYADADHVTHTLEQMRGLGVDRVKVSIVWSLLAPGASSHHRPHFDATDPNAYPGGAWDRYDLIVRVAHRLGMGVYFEFSPPIPKWAIDHKYPGGQGLNLGRAPKSSEFGRFAEAVGRRYSGSWPDPSASDQPSQPLTVLGVPVPIPGASTGSSQPRKLPRVGYWGLWNEPNYPAWLNPWHRRLKNGQLELTQPPIYRALVDAAWRGLAKAGHSHDTFLIGETANVGNVDPLPFAQDMYCVSSRYRPLSGRSAAAVGCPTRVNRSKFVSSNPGLFHATGWAHHPYSFNTAPDRRYPFHTWITTANVGTLERVMNEIYGAYRRRPHGGVPIYLTEWGYKTNPPNPYAGTSLAEQAAWLNEAAYMMWRLPYIKQTTQFLLQDFGPRVSAPKGSRAYWGTFQTGLEFHNYKPKPAYEAFRIPIWVPNPRHSSRVAVWGQLRPANHNALQYALVQFRRRGTHKWVDLTELRTSSSKGFLYNHVAIPSAGVIHLAWLDSANRKTYDSRDVAIS